MARPKQSTPQLLTNAELEVMKLLWQLHQATVTQIIEQINDPKPAYNTVSTIIRILTAKQFVDYTPNGKSYAYHPLISKDDYALRATDNLLNHFFEDSVPELVSFLIKKKPLSADDLTQLSNLFSNR